MKKNITAHKRNLADFFELGLNSDVSDTYVQSYPHLVSFFDGIDEIKSSDFVCACHMAYGWMPTILKLDPEVPGNFDYEATLLNRAREGVDLDASELGRLARTINHSFVGASKVLHFVAPEHYAIWDSRVFAFLYTKSPLSRTVARPRHDQINRIDRFMHYQNLLREMKAKPDFARFHQRIKSVVGDVSALRAIELVMYENSPDYKTKDKT